MATAAYARIAEDLRGKIASRDIKPGEQLPSELKLRDEYKASRNTVLDAIKKLKDEGLVETRPGHGWFARVRIVPFDNSLDWLDSTAIEEAKALGRTPQVTPPTVKLQAAPPDIARELGIAAGSTVISRRQEWYLDEVPWKLQMVWCPKSVYDQGAQQLLTAEDITEGLGAYLHTALDLQPASDAFYLLPRKPSGEEASFFGFATEGEPPYVIEFIRTASVAGTDRPQPLYTVVGVYAGDRNRFKTSKLFRPTG